MRINRSLLLGALLAVAGPAAWADEGHKHQGHKHEGHAAAEKVTMTGEILDLSCYLAHGGKGKEHKKCAKACLIEKHVSPGLLTADGKVYVLIPSHDNEKAIKTVGDFAAEKAKVTGRKVISGGLQAILVEKIEKE